MTGKERNPSRVLVEHLPILPRGRALDIACGDGRNSIYLAKHGFDVDAVDISTEALGTARRSAGNQNINFLQADLTEFKLPRDTYDLIVNFNYLQRSLVPAIKNGLKRGGYVIFETFTIEQKDLGHPKNPEFLLKPNELLRMFCDLHIIYYREGVFEEDKKKAIASLIGKKVT